MQTTSFLNGCIDCKHKIVKIMRSGVHSPHEVNSLSYGKRKVKTSGTLRAYRAAWKDFVRWCAQTHQEACPSTPSALMSYAYERYRVLSPSALRGRIAAIRHFHEQAGVPSPTDDETFQHFWADLQAGMVDEVLALDNQPPFYFDGKKRCIIPERSDDLRILRDRAVILTGIFGDLRRREIVGLDLEDARFDGGTVWLHVRKTRRDESPRTVILKWQVDEHLCPVRALQAWINKASIDNGPLFRAFTPHGRLLPHRLSDQMVTAIVKRAAKAAGFDPTDFSAEDLRQRPAK